MPSFDPTEYNPGLVNSAFDKPMEFESVFLSTSFCFPYDLRERKLTCLYHHSSLKKVKCSRSPLQEIPLNEL